MKKLLTLILLLVTFTTFSQNVTVSIENIKVDGTTMAKTSIPSKSWARRLAETVVCNLTQPNSNLNI